MEKSTTRRGSIYVLTLLTVTAVGSMVLIGVTVRGTRSNESMIIEQMNENGSGVMDAAEVAIARITADPDWVTNAQKGTVFTNLKVGDHTYSATVIDADMNALPTDATTLYRVTLTSALGITEESASIDILRNPMDYYEFLKGYGVKAYWALDDTPKTTKALEPEDKRHGTYLARNNVGAATTDEGGLVPVFATVGDYVETPYDADYQDDTEGTLSFWMKLTGTNLFTTYGLFGQRFQPDGMPSITMTCTSRSLSAYMDDAGNYNTGHIAATPQYSINVGQWHHVAMTWGPSGLTVYIDGVQEARTASCTEYWDTLDGKTGECEFIIGGGYIPAFVNQPLVAFDGSIARFAILDKQLTSTEIDEIASVKPDIDQYALVPQTWARVFD